jgi:hypothetical protein
VGRAKPTSAATVRGISNEAWCGLHRLRYRGRFKGASGIGRQAPKGHVGIVFSHPLTPMPTEIQIEKGVPIPELSGGRPKSDVRLAFEKMEVGDSIVIERERLQLHSIKHLAKRVGIKVTQRQVNCEGRRIWRVA